MLRVLVRRSLRRDFSSGSLRILLTALIVAVAAVSAVGFFTDRVSRAMEQQAGDLLAADLRIVASRPLPEDLQRQADDLGLVSAEVISFPTVVLNEEDDSLLVAVKAVSDAYPLRGKLLTSQPGKEAAPQINEVPVSGTVAVDPALIRNLSLDEGSPLLVGSIEMPVTSVVVQEPDQGGSLFQMAPRLLMNSADLERAGLLVEGSRARYALLLSGDEDQLGQFRQ